MCRAEDELIRTHPRFRQSCKQFWMSECPVSWSLGTYVAVLNRKQSCDYIDDVDVSNTRALLTRCAPYYLQWLNSSSLPSASCGLEQAPFECNQFHAAYNIFHFLATRDFASRVSSDPDAELEYVTNIIPIALNYTDDLVSIYMDRFHRQTYKNKEVTLKAINFWIKLDLYNMFLFSDFLYVGIGLISVVLVLWIYTESICITLTACLNFLLSYLMAFFFYFIIFRRAFFPFVNIVAAVLVIGVGADDTFVYVDIWRQSLSELKGSPLHVIVQNTLHHATVTMLVTSLTTAGSLYANIISDITPIKCFGLFAGTAILMNFLLTLTLLPAVIIVQHRFVTWYNKGNEGKHETGCSKCCRFLGKIRTLCLTPIRPFFHRILPIIIVKLRLLWLFVFGALGIGGALVVFIYPGLQLPSSGEFQILKDDNYLELWDLKYKDLFRFSDDANDRLEGYILFGIKSVDTSNTRWDPDDRGELILDDTFSFYSKEHQTWMTQFCDDLKDQNFYYYQRVGCFMESLRIFMSRPCVDPFTGIDASPCCNNQSFPYDKDTFETCIRLCVAPSPGMLGPCYYSVRFNNETDKMAAIFIAYESSAPISFDFNIMQTYWTDTNSWMEQQMIDAPDSLKNGWIISQGDRQLYFFDVQNSLATGAPFSLGITLAVVSLILFATIMNIFIALYAIITVAFAVFVTVGSLVLLGWELNIFESVILILSVGLCVDFTIHYGVAYTLAQVSEPTRSLRTEYSIRTMTGAISVAALSTFLAGVFMLAANINAYLQLGVFLTLVMSISWTYSTFFFQSLCRVIGPQAHYGDIFGCWCCKLCRKDGNDMKGQDYSLSAAQGHDNQVFYNDNATTQL